MKRLFGVSALTLLLAGCSSSTTQSPPSLTDQTFNLAQASSKAVTQPFGGNWQISSSAPWLSVSSDSGRGNINVTLRANRSLSTPLAADQKTLSAQLLVTWTQGSQSGSAHWTVNASQFLLSGRVSSGGQVSAKDIQSGLLAPVAPGGEVAQSVIVTYQSAAIRNAVLQPSNLQTQSVQESASRATLQKLNIAVSQRVPLAAKSVVLHVPATSELLSALKADPNVQSVAPNARLYALNAGAPPVTASNASAKLVGPLAQQPLANPSLASAALASPVVPNDQFAPLQWAYRLLGYGAVWRDIETGAYNKPVTVAVIDTGVRYDHPDLAGKLYLPSEGALDVITDSTNGDGDGVDRDPTDPDVAGRTSGSHGTHVTGIIVANWGTFPAPCTGCSTSGVVGASYKAPIKVLPIRALDATGGTDAAAVINAVLYAAGVPVTISGQTFTNPHPAQVINMSLGGAITATTAQPICDAVATAAARGSLIFVAAGNGNDGGTTPFYPAACPGAVSVASVSLSGASAPLHAAYSQEYSQVQLSAPGGAGTTPTYFNGATMNGAPFGDYIISTSWDYPKNQPSYEAESGTSQAAPQASALAALLLSKGVSTTASDTLSRMISTATDLGTPGRDPLFGYGMINPVAALGAPAVSNALGLRLQDASGNPFQPALNATGHFDAYLGDGKYQVVAGYDQNGNGIYGENGEPAVTQQVTLSPAQPNVDLGTLIPSN